MFLSDTHNTIFNVDKIAHTSWDLGICFYFISYFMLCVMLSIAIDEDNNDDDDLDD